MKNKLIPLLLLFVSITGFAEEKVDLKALFGQEDEFLQVDEAFQLSVNVFEKELIASWKVAPAYYLYKHRLAYKIEHATLGMAFVPEGKPKTDEYFGDVEIYEKLLEISLAYSDVTQTPFKLTLEYQGCADAGLCYPPTTRIFSVDPSTQTATLLDDDEATRLFGSSEPAQESTDTESTAAQPQSADKPFVSEKDQIIGTLNDSSLIYGFVLMIVLGVGLAFTPCVFPMMPIISSIIVGQGENISTSKALALSVTYTQAMAIPYTILGMFVAALGAGATSFFQSAPFVIFAAAVFCILAIGMFGFFEIQMPASVQNKLNNVSQNQQGGTYLGVAIMGALSGVVVSPCVTIPLIAVLTWIAQTGDSITGGVYLYGLALGMGIPLIIVGVGGSKLLPRAGGWMDAVKAAFGVIMLMVALYVSKHLIPDTIEMLLWAILIIVVAVYMGALRQVEQGWPHLWKGLGVVLLIYGTLILVGAAMGNTNPLKPIASFKQPHVITESTPDEPAKTKKDYVDHAGFTLIKSSADLDKYIAQAKAENKTVMLDFFAEYCTACYEFAELTFPDPRVQKALENTILLQADVTKGDKLDLELMSRFKIFGLPSILFFDKNGKELSGLRAEGFEDAETFLLRIDAAIGED
ncbi:protein-disulfide reductase DsbD [Pleionea sp. CnH1-48]|uniref:protein-disulfide reductase DsbD n=1 Tax=Pleionea sp. CnH1-48 TaxID=2954494 RepID=UPI0020971CAA|nr:protein-disulfide reductase DsbD [Pleionea sp. CnH1-48]MCO7224655.1 protein-disulfide reductase DsbD [Pleionea sp. CnH1-48]